MNGGGGRAAGAVMAAVLVAAGTVAAMAGLPSGAAAGAAEAAGAEPAASAAAAPSLTATGYWLGGADGAVYPFGDAPFLGSMSGSRLVSPIVTLGATSTGRGYWMAAADGGMFNFGDAGFFGAMGGKPLNQPIVGMAARPQNDGYWLVARDGGIFAFGQAGFSGSMGGQPLNRPVVGMASAPGTNAYWMVATDGGIFAFGGAPFKGSMGGKPLNEPIVGMASTPTGQGYWLVARDGGVFAFGDAGFHGSMGGKPLNRPIIGMAATPSGKGYWMVASDGGMFSFGDAPFLGSTGGQALAAPIVGMTPRLTPASEPVGDPVVLSAGDIAGCDTSGDEATAALLDNRPGTIIPPGDLAYPYGTLEEFQNCYGPTWGRHRGRTRPAPGNHEYTSGATGYFDYFGSAAGERGKGYYSFDLGSWHVVSLNSEDCTDANGCPASSAQITWLKQDLAASDAECTLAYWHKPAYGSNEDEPDVWPLWQAAHEGGVDVVIVGHHHIYERFAPLGPTGAVDENDGTREFIVGTGGRSHHGLRSTTRAGSETRDNTSYGIVSMTLKPGGYTWEFIPVAGASYTDSGADTCRND